MKHQIRIDRQLVITVVVELLPDKPEKKSNQQPRNDAASKPKRSRRSEWYYWDNNL